MRNGDDRDTVDAVVGDDPPPPWQLLRAVPHSYIHATNAGVDGPHVLKVEKKLAKDK
jgi:hypothetical protein